MSARAAGWRSVVGTSPVSARLLKRCSALSATSARGTKPRSLATARPERAARRVEAKPKLDLRAAVARRGPELHRALLAQRATFGRLPAQEPARAVLLDVGLPLEAAPERAIHDPARPLAIDRDVSEWRHHQRQRAGLQPEPIDSSAGLPTVIARLTSASAADASACRSWPASAVFTPSAW